MTEYRSKAQPVGYVPLRQFWNCAVLSLMLVFFFIYAWGAWHAEEAIAALHPVTGMFFTSLIALHRILAIVYTILRTKDDR